MKKATILAMACALFMGGTALAQAPQEVTYVEDPSQGYLFNRFKDNWFIQGEGGANIYFSHGDSDRKLGDRFSPAAGVYVGKWFSPIIALRAGVSYLRCKGLSDIPTPHTRFDDTRIDGKYKQEFNEVGPVFDVMLNLTNWWCGYHPGRKYNAIFYAGGGGYFSYSKKYDPTTGKPESKGYVHDEDRVMTFRAGLINAFNVSKQVQLYLDLRYSGIDNHQDEAGDGWNRTSHDVQAYIGVTYLFKKREWNAPVVPVCPEPENCDAIRARLEAANARIAELEDELAKKPEPVKEEVKKAPLATIYYPINIYKLTKKDVVLLQGVADVMKDNPQQVYTLTGWADNFTGNDVINTRLRHNRVNGVEKQLVKFGVPKAQLNTTINAGNLCGPNEKYMALDRAVTIVEGNAN